MAIFNSYMFVITRPGRYIFIRRFFSHEIWWLNQQRWGLRIKQSKLNRWANDFVVVFVLVLGYVCLFG